MIEVSLRIKGRKSIAGKGIAVGDDGRSKTLLELMVGIVPVSS